MENFSLYLRRNRFAAALLWIFFSVGLLGGFLFFAMWRLNESGLSGLRKSLIALVIFFSFLIIGQAWFDNANIKRLSYSLMMIGALLGVLAWFTPYSRVWLIPTVNIVLLAGAIISGYNSFEPMRRVFRFIFCSLIAFAAVLIFSLAWLN